MIKIIYIKINYKKTAKREGWKHLGREYTRLHPTPLHTPMTVFLQPGGN